MILKLIEIYYSALASQSLNTNQKILFRPEKFPNPM
jgi:hypothetical protein